MSMERESQEEGFSTVPLEKGPASIWDVWNEASIGVDVWASGEEITDPLFYRAVIAEFFATLGLVVLTLLPWLSLQDGIMTDGGVLRASLSAGLAFFVLNYMFGGVSGGHMNPAVSLALLLGKRITLVRMLLYWVAQVLGAITGAAMVRGISPSAFRHVHGGANVLETGGRGAAVAIELLGTLPLVLAFLFFTDRKRSNYFPSIPVMAPWEVGMAVLVSHLTLLPFTRCSINPARSFGASAASGEWSAHWVWWVGPLLASGLGVVMYELLFRANYFMEPLNRAGRG